eukprot:jgi/Mesen1/4513/ME000023S03889
MPKSAAQLFKMVPLLVLISFFSVVQGIDVSPQEGTGPQINSLNLLLPPLATRPVKYKLEGTNGCFTWSWDHHDLISVEPLFDSPADPACSTGALVASVAPYQGRRATAIRATDALTGRALRCEVFVDRIASVRIFHRSLKLDLDGLATLEVQGFDAEDDTFSSLAGLEFAWDLKPIAPSLAPAKGKAGGAGQLRGVALGSDVYVVRGVGAGQEQVAARLVQDDGADKDQDLVHAIVLTVAEAFSVEPPSPVYVVPGTRVPYRVRTFRRNAFHEVELPSPNYRWSADNERIAAVDPQAGVATGLRHGTTLVRVEDVRVAGHEQTSSLHVVTPVTIRLLIQPYWPKGPPPGIPIKETPAISSSESSRWQLVVGREYLIQVQAFSRESGSRPLLLTQDNDLRLLLANEPVWFTKAAPEREAGIHGWLNSSLLLAAQEGEGSLSALLRFGELQPAADATGGSPGELTAVDRQVSPVDLPTGWTCWLAVFWYHWCGLAPADYRWSSSDPSVATVTPNGAVWGKAPGKALIRATAQHDALNFDEVIADISVPSALEEAPGLPVATQAGGALLAAVALLDSAGNHYTSSSAVAPLVKWHVQAGQLAGSACFEPLSHPPSLSAAREAGAGRGTPEAAATTAVGAAPPEQPPGSCSWTLLRAASPCRAMVVASLDLEEIFANEVLTKLAVPPKLEASWLVVSYHPLEVELAAEEPGLGVGLGFGLGSELGFGFGSSGTAPCPEGGVGAGTPLKELLLAPGGSVEVHLKGGPDSWQPGIEFEEGGEVVGEVEGVDVRHLAGGGGRMYRLTCAALGSYEVRFSRSIVPSGGHRHRHVATTTLAVGCEIPSSVVLLVDQSDGCHSAIAASAGAERSTDRRHLAPLTVINGRHIRVAAVALNAADRPFANASSLALSWQLEAIDHLARWGQPGEEAEAGGEGGDSTAAALQEGGGDSTTGRGRLGPWERILVLSDQPGECVVRVSAKDLVLSPGSPRLAAAFASEAHKILASRLSKLTDAVQLQLVKALRLEPQAVLLFNHPAAKAVFTVTGGTTLLLPELNDTQVALILPTPPGNKLAVGAKSAGTAELVVKDEGLAHPTVAHALLGANMTLHMRAEDAAGRIFDPSQLRRHLALPVAFCAAAGGQLAPNSVRVRGVAVGLITTLHVSVRLRSGQVVRSEYGRVAVYAPLATRPSRLHLAPGADYVVAVEGGPRTASGVQFSSSNASVASVDPTSGRVLAKSEGSATITAVVVGPRGELLCEATSALTVQVPHTMSLHVRGGRLAVGQQMSVFVTGGAEDEDVLSFAAMCSHYHWSAGDNQGYAVLGWAGLLRSAGLEAIGGTDKLRLRAEGRTSVKVTFRCAFLRADGQSEDSITYSASGAIWVVPAPNLAQGMCATWLLPLLYTSSPLLPHHAGASGGAQARIGGASKSIAYSVLEVAGVDAPTIELADGRIRTFDRPDVACIKARQGDTCRSEIASCVRTAEVRQLASGPDDVWRRELPLPHRGAIGTPFYEASVEGAALQVDTNHPHVVAVAITSSQLRRSEPSSNITLTIQALRQGSAIVRVRLGHRSPVLDYIAVTPQPPTPLKFLGSATLHVGARFNFSLAGSGSTRGEKGLWSSGDEHVVEINAHTGEARAVAEGATTVSFNGTRLTSYTPVSVVRVSAVSVEAPLEAGAGAGAGAPRAHARPLSNAPADQQAGFLFPVKFSDAHGNEVGRHGEGPAVVYSCQVEPAYLGSAKPWYDPTTHAHFCIFSPTSPEELWAVQRQVGRALASQGPGGMLSLKVGATVAGPPPTEGQVEVQFIGGFSLVDPPLEVYLTPAANRSIITVLGNAGSVAVSWGKRGQLSVRRVSRQADAAGIAGRALFEIKVVEQEKTFADTVTFTLPATGQKIELPVAFNEAGGARAPSAESIALTALLGVATALATWLLAKCYEQRSALVTPPPLPGSNSGVLGLGSRASPGGGSQHADGGLYQNGMVTPVPQRLQQSSRSPSHPYTEYVSRTVDQTPYYLGDTARRLDPSFTY